MGSFCVITYSGVVALVLPALQIANIDVALRNNAIKRRCDLFELGQRDILVDMRLVQRDVGFADLRRAIAPS